MTVDHIIPKSRGGKNTFENTVCSCFECNNKKKQNRTPKEAGMFLKKTPHQPTVSEFTNLWFKAIDMKSIMQELGLYVFENINK